MEAERKKEKTWPVDLSLLIIAMARDFSWSDRPKYMLTFFLALLSLTESKKNRHLYFEG